MSYIRCTSNPEGIYIYAGDNGLNIIYNAKHNNMTGVVCDIDVFHTFVNRWVAQYYPSEFSFGNISITEENRTGIYKYYLHIDNHEIEMWDVTWMYIVHNTLDRDDMIKIIIRGFYDIWYKIMNIFLRIRSA